MWSHQGTLALSARASASKAITDWNSFYASTIQPAYQFIGTFAVILVALSIASSLTSRFFVRVDAVAWPKAPRRCAQALGNALILASALLLPLYGMFHPFEADTVQDWWSWGVLGAVAFLFAALCAWGYSTSENRKAFWEDWRLPAVVVAVIAGVTVLATALLLGVMNVDTPWRRLLLTYLAIATLGVVIIAVSIGQGCRVEVGVRDCGGSPDAAATSYLLGRLRTLGKEQAQGINATDPSSMATSLGSLEQQDLSGIPGNQIAATLMRLWSALRPDLTWRAQITIVDENRAAMRLLRNGRLARASIFSRSDLGLNLAPEGDAGTGATDKSVVNRAQAQLLTGAAAFIVTELSLLYPALRLGLCGATEWRSVTLQVIGSSFSLSEKEDACALLRQAANMDPDNAIAQYEYIRELHEQLEVPYDVNVLDAYDTLGNRALEGSNVKPGWESLYMSILYRSADAALGMCATGGNDSEERLKRAKTYADNLKGICDAYLLGRPRPGDDVAAKARRLIPFAKNVQNTVDLMLGGAARLEENESFASPTVAYNSACLEAHALALGLGGEENRKALIRNLTLATGTDKVKSRARTDPDLSSVRHDDLVVGLVGRPPNFLGFKLFAPFQARLNTAGLTTAASFARATRTAAQRRQTARHLAVPSSTIDQLHDIAAMAAVHPQLDDADMLRLLTGRNIESPSQLREQVATDRVREVFLRELTKDAEKRGLASLPAVQSPQEWVTAACASDRQRLMRCAGQWRDEVVLRCRRRWCAD